MKALTAWQFSVIYDELKKHQWEGQRDKDFLALLLADRSDFSTYALKLLQYVEGDRDRSPTYVQRASMLRAFFCSCMGDADYLLKFIEAHPQFARLGSAYPRRILYLPSVVALLSLGRSAFSGPHGFDPFQEWLPSIIGEVVLQNWGFSYAESRDGDQARKDRKTLEGELCNLANAYYSPMAMANAGEVRRHQTCKILKGMGKKPQAEQPKYPDPIVLQIVYSMFRDVGISEQINFLTRA